MHPGINRTEMTIRQHFTWPSLTQDVSSIVGKCLTCQLTKKTKQKVGQPPPKTAEVTPWDTLCVDLMGPHTIKRKGKTDLTLHCLTMIDPATGWFETCQMPTKRADCISDLAEQTWLSRHPWPQKVTCDRGGEFMAETKTMLQEDCGCKVNQITARNPQANAILERTHQTIGDMIGTFQAPTRDGTDEEDPFSGLLSAVAFATRATVHTTLGATPSQLVFGRDATLDTGFQANWDAIQAKKQKTINQNNARENAKQKPHVCKTGDRMLLKTESNAKHGANPHEGPCDIVAVNDNGTIKCRKRNTIDAINVRNVHPFKE